MQMNIEKIIYLNCGERYEEMIDHRSYIYNFSCYIIIYYLISQLIRFSLSPRFKYMFFHIFICIKAYVGRSTAVHNLLF